MKKKLLAVIALVLMASVIFCGFTVAAEESVSVGQTYTYIDSGNEMRVSILDDGKCDIKAVIDGEEYSAIGEYTYDGASFTLYLFGEELGVFDIVGDTLSPKEAETADEPAIDGGNWFLENWKSLAEALLGTGGVAFVVGLLAFVNKIVQLRATLKTTNVNNADIKNAVNGMIDEISALGEAVKTMKDDNTHAIAVLSDKEADVAAKNEAVCKVIAALISASALPDETKNYLLGDMNSVLNYKDGESNDEESKG